MQPTSYKGYAHFVHTDDLHALFTVAGLNLSPEIFSKASMHALTTNVHDTTPMQHDTIEPIPPHVTGARLANDGGNDCVA
jgi:hypothetical protein